MARILLIFCLVSSLALASEPVKDTEAVWDILGRAAQIHQETPELKKTLSGRVSLVGWVIPNEFDSGALVSFLLARFPGGCIHVPLPPPYYVVSVVMGPKAKKLKNITSTQKVLVEGTLKSGGRVDASYELTAESLSLLN